MKKILCVVILTFATPFLYAGSTKTTTTTQYEETSNVPGRNTDMIQEQEAYGENYDDEVLEDDEQYSEERMEENDSIIEDEEKYIDYDDRTRTNRERKALNTGSDASDDN